ncbi:SPOR domain-containing protein [Phosphitispora sp. TUW77]|uniref:SPOR domain-containing protein n=1 Tax=Phosphitispora sp. TUW77 TaxID=3152361 RepID=UPI003AB2F249
MRLIIRFRPAIGILLCFFGVSAASLAGAYLLGKTFLMIIGEDKLPESTRVMTGDPRPAAAQVQKYNLLLDPVPVYYLQVGVYSDPEGALEAAKPLRDMGYNPYITKYAPYRIWVGVFRERKDTEQLKQELKEYGYGSFTGAVVINGKNLQYGKDSELFIKEISPVLKAYTAWLKEVLIVLPSGSSEILDFRKERNRFSVLEEVYQKIPLPESEVKFKNHLMNTRFRNVDQSISNFHTQLNECFELQDPDMIVLLQYKLLEFIDNYLLFCQEINNISAT